MDGGGALATGAAGDETGAVTSDDGIDEVVDVTPDDEDDAEHRLDEQELESFPASDPHSEWQGPPN